MMDLAKLRFGSFVKEDPRPDGTVDVYFFPFDTSQANPLGKPEIITVPNHKFCKFVNRFTPKKGSWELYYMILKDEDGSSQFLEQELNSVVPELLDKIHKMDNKLAITKAVSETDAMTAMEGRKGVLRDVAEEHKIVTPQREEQDSLRKRRRVPFGALTEGV
jgi:hypothetical protein